MSGDMLVMKIAEYGALDSENELSKLGLLVCAYIYYDYKTELFGVCVEYKNASSGKHGDFSYYSDNKDVLTDLLSDLLTDPKRTEVSLMNYKYMPRDSDEITFELLNDDGGDEITCYAYNQDFDEEDEDEDTEEFPSFTIKRYLKIIESVFNTF